MQGWDWGGLRAQRKPGRNGHSAGTALLKDGKALRHASTRPQHRLQLNMVSLDRLQGEGLSPASYRIQFHGTSSRRLPRTATHPQQHMAGRGPLARLHPRAPTIVDPETSNSFHYFGTWYSESSRQRWRGNPLHLGLPAGGPDPSKVPTSRMPAARCCHAPLSPAISQAGTKVEGAWLSLTSALELNVWGGKPGVDQEWMTPPLQPSCCSICIGMLQCHRWGDLEMGLAQGCPGSKRAPQSTQSATPKIGWLHRRD